MKIGICRIFVTKGEGGLKIRKIVLRIMWTFPDVPARPCFIPEYPTSFLATPISKIHHKFLQGFQKAFLLQR